MKPYSLDFRGKIIDAYYMDGLSQRQLAKRLRVSLSFVENLLKRLHETGDILSKLTRKKTVHATEQETPRSQYARVDYRKVIRKIPPEDLVFIDEAGVNLAMIGLYARALRGSRAVGTRPHRSRAECAFSRCPHLEGSHCPPAGLGFDGWLDL